MAGELYSLLDTPVPGQTFPSGLRIFAALYFLWGIMWALVAYHYGRASKTSWTEQGGTWKEALRDFFRPYAHGWRHLVSVIWKDAKNLDVNEVPTRYTVGHYLRFSIFIGAISPIFIILMFHPEERAGESWLAMISACLLLLTSTVGASGHLYIAYRLNPPAWSRLVILSTLWIILAPLIFTVFNWP